MGYTKMIEKKTCTVEYLEKFAQHFKKPILYFFDADYSIFEDSDLVVVNECNQEKFPDNIKKIPFWNLPVTAGKNLSEIIGSHSPDAYIIGKFPGADLVENIFPVSGTSMEPEILDGSIIGVRRMNNWDILDPSKIYLIITHEDRMIKRIDHDQKNKKILWCISPNHSSFKILKEEIIEIHRVCFVYNAK